MKDMSTLVLTIIGLLGGLGLFLYGMNIMADGLQKSAGSKMKKLLSVLTTNRFLGVAVGALVTAIIQSSSATTVMVVGFVNAGLLNLLQATGVIMGANIGTTITSWIVSLGEWASFLKPSTLAPLAAGIGAMMFVFGNDRKRQAGEDVYKRQSQDCLKCAHRGALITFPPQSHLQRLFYALEGASLPDGPAAC